ncbi:MAG: plasmid pRiA4b ORF-3 family protein [Actinomycetota bacterium]|nr:plasmid pRiA4b ORF-3 family protein [Actinomycetota bacterium]
MQKTKPLQANRLPLPEMRCLSIGVTLRACTGRALPLPRPERVLIASPRHTFADLALAIDEAFGRWELGSGREYSFEDGSRAGEAVDGSRRRDLVDDRRARLYRLREGERFVYLADTGERWEHECVVVGWIDPDEVLLDGPSHPVVYQARGRNPAVVAGGRTTG